MKKLVLASLTGLALSCASLQAAEVTAYFDNATNQLVLPHLEVNGVVYYATLTLVDATTLTFQANLETITDLTPPDNVPENTDVSAIVGTWTVASVGQDNLTITFNSDGTYSHFEQGNDDCTNGGGREEGSYNWETSTGVLQLLNLTLDENGECGLSHPRDGVPLRLFVDGNTAEVIERAEGGGSETFQFVRVD